MFKIKNEPNLSGLRVGFVTPMEPLSKTLNKLTHFLPGFKPGDILSPRDVTKNDRYDILLVDEAHRLENCFTAGAGIGAFYNTCDRLGLPHTSNQVDWIFKCCDKAHLFYDPNSRFTHLDSIETALSSDSISSKKLASRPKDST